jgi:hypothetical protein
MFVTSLSTVFFPYFVIDRTSLHFGVRIEYKGVQPMLVMKSRKHTLERHFGFGQLGPTKAQRQILTAFGVLPET